MGKRHLGWRRLHGSGQNQPSSFAAAGRGAATHSERHATFWRTSKSGKRIIKIGVGGGGARNSHLRSLVRETNAFTETSVNSGRRLTRGRVRPRGDQRSNPCSSTGESPANRAERPESWSFAAVVGCFHCASGGEMSPKAVRRRRSHPGPGAVLDRSGRERQLTGFG